MAAATALAAGALRAGGFAVRPGARLGAVKARAERYAKVHGARDVRVFTSLNATAAHGAPEGITLRDGDLLTLDVSLCRNGWYGDVAWSFIAGRGNRAARRLLAAAWEAAWSAAHAARGGARVGDVARRVRETARRFRFGVAEECAGHGIGRSLHEAPAMGYADPRVDGYLVPGMVFTVEPVLTAGSGLLLCNPAGSGLVTADGSLAAQFELTVAVLSFGPVLLNPAVALDPGVDTSGDAP